MNILKSGGTLFLAYEVRMGRASATSNTDDILHEHDGLPHVPLLTVHLEMVLISVNSSSMCAGILIKVRQAILMTFSMIMLSSPMSPLSLSTW